MNKKAATTRRVSVSVMREFNVVRRPSNVQYNLDAELRRRCSAQGRVDVAAYARALIKTPIVDGLTWMTRIEVRCRAEYRQISAAAVTYTYDVDGKRVTPQSGTSGGVYSHGLGGEVLAETDLSGNTTNEYIYFAGGRIARRDSAGNVYYY